MAASTLSAMIDPTKQAEYPIVLGERLAQNPDTSPLVNINYNYKSKSATPKLRTTITNSESSDLYDLALTYKAPNADHTLAYTYKGSEDPSSDRSLVLVFDPERKVFVLEPVSTTLNFNLRSAPGKTENQVREQYEQLQIKEEDEHTNSVDDHLTGSTSDDDGAPDDDNPYDFRHFLAKNSKEEAQPISSHTTPEPTSQVNTPLIPPSQPPSKPPSQSAHKPAPRPKTQANPLRQKKPVVPKPRVAPEPKVAPEPEPVPQPDLVEYEDAGSSPSDAGTGSQHTGVPSPGSNIIVDGDLIIDMGSPPPVRSSVAAYFSSNNNTPAEDDGDENIGTFSLPSPIGKSAPPPLSTHADTTVREDEAEEEDDLAAEMEAAFEESARLEEAHQYSPATARKYVPSDDESEVSEEE